MAQIFLLNYAGHNLDDAKKYGTIRFITEGNVPVFDIDRLCYNIAIKLQEYKYDPDEDYIAPSGNSTIGLCVGLELQKRYGDDHEGANLLIWNSITRRYKKRFLQFKKVEV